MATVAEMIEFFKTLPQDAIVECGDEVNGWYGPETVMRPVDIESIQVLDYSSEENRQQFPQMEGKILIRLHGE
jgi:hypothetical protein